MIGFQGLRTPKRLYSSTISQDFLRNVLERVKETASKKPLSNNGGTRNRNPRGPRGNKEGRSTRGASSESRDNFRRVGNKTVPGNDSEAAPRPKKPWINANVVNRQPQFQRKTGAAGLSSKQKVDESLMDALDAVQQGNVKGKPQTTRGRRAPKTAQKSVPGMSQSPGSVEGIVAQAKKSTVSRQYVPDEPTPLSLLKYAPKLAYSSSSKMSSFGVSTLDQSDFPLTRRVNLGVATSPSQKPLNVSLSPRTAAFGQYAPASSLVWCKEKLLKNVSIRADFDQFESSVNGKYEKLVPATERDFQAVSKNNQKRAELVNNSDVVRLSLQKSNMDFASKSLVYQVCSGLEPISSLKA
ncbi:mitochondrial 37S ribosomal protein mS46 RSM28 [Lachancea thermotolerans CBS 6340]|uniref:KLTH0C09438p n=1 Tax=Lachancea thermotolerans (strain ATCC 56472 / CBS 6340 / NRRL Y-8284) TaxID=559295 RepID=C5DEI2_LACTC|nr:KLTH0C09438p [Lachancea thermotolerans CBS 6340]CAR22193.1 KLTH0C09438p [Lachancea thermotolerans CBS 6340]